MPRLLAVGGDQDATDVEGEQVTGPTLGVALAAGFQQELGFEKAAPGLGGTLEEFDSQPLLLGRITCPARRRSLHSFGSVGMGTGSRRGKTRD